MPVRMTPAADFGFLPPFEEKILQRHYNIHRQRIEKVKSKVDSSVPLLFPAAVPKFKNVKSTFTRKNEITKQNISLKERLERVFQAPKKEWSTTGTTINSRNNHRSRANSTINVNNTRFLNRLQTTTTHYPRRDQLASFQFTLSHSF